MTLEISDEFDAWIRELEEDVIQGDYGYEPGEFTVFPAMWEPQFKAGRTPQEAFKRALDAYAEKREDNAG